MKIDLVKFAVAGLVAALCSPAMAQWNPSGTQAERALLPQFCLVKLKDDNRSPEAQAFIRQFGFDNWLHMHHYCYALNFVSRAQKAGNTRDRNSQLQLAVADYNYVLRGTKPDFWMRPQLYLELGRLHVRLNRQVEATEAFKAAIHSNPSYQAAYIALIDQLRRNGDRGQAREIAELGLRHLPDAERLQSLYLELGGKRPFPEPISKTPVSAPPSEAPSERAPETIAPQERTTESDASSPPNADAQTESAAESGQNCRFCPPEEIQRRWQESFQ